MLERLQSRPRKLEARAAKSNIRESLLKFSRKGIESKVEK